MAERKDIPIKDIQIDEFLTRVYIDPEELERLKSSIKQHGLLQPIVVAKKGKKYKLLAGFRRYTACKELGWETIPANIIKATGEQEIILSEIENLVRQNVDPITQAYHFKKLRTDYGLTSQQIAAKLDVSDAYVRNYIRLLDLPDDIQALIAAGQLTPSHGLELLRLPEEKYMRIIAKRIIEHGLTITQTRMEVAKQIDYIRKWEEERKKEQELKQLQEQIEKGEIQIEPPPQPPQEYTTPPEEWIPKHKCPICGQERPAQEIQQRLICTWCIGQAMKAAEEHYKQKEGA